MGFLDVADIEDRLDGQQLRLFQDALFLEILGFGQPRGLAGAQQVERLAEHRGRGLGLLVAAGRLLLKRSEEHTSELQSLMRISYAVFCLQKQTHTKEHIITDTTKCNCN